MEYIRSFILILILIIISQSIKGGTYFEPMPSITISSDR